MAACPCSSTSRGAVLLFCQQHSVFQIPHTRSNTLIDYRLPKRPHRREGYRSIVGIATTALCFATMLVNIALAWSESAMRPTSCERCPGCLLSRLSQSRMWSRLDSGSHCCRGQTLLPDNILRPLPPFAPRGPGAKGAICICI